MQKTDHDVQYCIIGAGIAGLSLADTLSERNASVVVVEKDKIAAGASSTPGGLVNPATGRRATKAWRAEECYKAIRESLEKVQCHIGEPFFRNNGVLRPALTEKMARKMQEQLEKTSWPDGWCTWLDEDGVKAKHPGINCVEGGLWLPMGLTVHVGRYLQGLADYLTSHDVPVLMGNVPEILISNSGWNIKCGSVTVRAKQLIFATGYETTSFSWWHDLPLHPVKGQVACFEADAGLMDFNHSISSLGYIARLDKPTEFIQGSTYEHDFAHADPDEYGKEYLHKRLYRTLPELADNARLKYQWAGVRASTPNRKPILGRHREIDNLHVFTGLGSKGLLYGKYLAEHYTDHLLNGASVHKAVSIERLNKK